jgi:hypothetical protein
MSYLIEAIWKLRPESEFSFIDEDYSTIKWDILQGKAPTQTEIDAAIEQIKADEITNEEKKATEKAALLTKLGITADEAALLLS